MFPPFALDRKYPSAAREWGWQYVFPGGRLAVARVQELLGHSGVSTTMIYTHALDRGGKGVVSPPDKP